jgi:hypothetical protein
MDGKEKLILSPDEIRIEGIKVGAIVMHRGEKSTMYKLAEIVTKNGGDILELGFGMHISADAIQSNPKVKSHTIIEVHPEIYKHALQWAKDKPNTKILLGDWVDVLSTITDKFDGILYDTHLDDSGLKLFDYVKPNCKVGTIVGLFGSFYPDDIKLSAYRHRITDEERETLPYSGSPDWKNDYELKYAIFNGTDFQKDNIIKSLI